MNNSYTCIIVDDEPKAIDLLRQLVAELYPNITVAGTYTTWQTGLEALRTKEPDIAFIDISMPQKTGIEMLSFIPSLKSEVIFVTAYPEYALEAFELFVTGYLLKPVSETKLVKAIEKAIAQIERKRPAATSIAPTANQHNKIAIPNVRGYDYVDVNDIIYLEAVKRYTKVVTHDTSILSSYSIGNFVAVLETKGFFQIHRSYLVNIRFVKKYDTAGVVVLTNDVTLPVSRQNRDALIELFTTSSSKK